MWILLDFWIVEMVEQIKLFFEIELPSNRLHYIRRDLDSQKIRVLTTYPLTLSYTTTIFGIFLTW